MKHASEAPTYIYAYPRGASYGLGLFTITSLVAPLKKLFEG